MQKRILYLSIVMLLSWGCASKNTETKEGERLSQQYCSGCHVRPEPQVLPKRVWAQSVLPAMGAFADIYKDKTREYKVLPETLKGMRDPALASVKWNIPLEDWNKIVTYYTSQAPEKLAVPAFQTKTSNDYFQVKSVFSHQPAYTACVYFDGQSKLLFQSSLSDQKLNIYNHDLVLTDSMEGCGGVVQVVPLARLKTGEFQFLLIHIGNINPRSVRREGFLETVTVRAGKIVERKKRITDLYRPVQSIVADLDGTGSMDIVVCEFGFMEGRLSVFGKKTDGTYSQNILSNQAGAEVVYVEDINQDGLKDLWVLFASGREGIYQFINKGGGHYEQKVVMEFPPEYGSTFFYLIDFDKDGLKDIVYTCGDNADMSQILKPYHGFYMFKNTGNGYKQHFFKHINGCYKALPGDFNADGKLDWAVISFFADFEKSPQEGFLWLINDDKGRYDTYYSTSEIMNTGRWLCMDVGDVNGDHQPDIILGNMAAQSGNNQALVNRWIDGPAFIILEGSKQAGENRTNPEKIRSATL